MQALTGLDSSFLYLETPTIHMHVGSVMVFEGSMDFDGFRNLLLSRIHLVPRLRQRLVQVPLSLDYPYWVDDPDFNINMHLQHVALPRPGNWRELRKLASRVFSEPLDRSRALWEIVFVEGLDEIPQVPPGSVAIIGKVHHAAIDGVSGADMLGILFDTSPDPREVEPPSYTKPEPIPNEVELVARSAYNFMTKPLKLPRLVADTVSATVKAGMLTRVQGIDLPTVPFAAPPTRLNGVISPQRVWNTALLSLDRVKNLKNIMGITVNDVVLAICAGALRRYLLEHGELPSKPLVALVPVSTRSKSERDGQGNKISAMLIQLATDIEDPIERLKKIHDNASSGKMYQHAVGAKMLSELADFVPFGLAGMAARTYSRMHIAEMHNPIFNVTITNVPGPQIDLYVAGHKLLANMGMAPIIDGMGLIIPVLSYNGVLSFSPTSDINTMPDIDKFTRYLREAANELEAEVLKLEPEPEEEEIVIEPASTAFFEHANHFLQENPDFLRPNTGTFQYFVTGQQPRQWVMELNEPPGKIYQGEIEGADATFTIQDDHLIRMLTGDLGPQIAFMQGKLKISGDINKALKLGGLLNKLPRP